MTTWDPKADADLDWLEWMDLPTGGLPDLASRDHKEHRVIGPPGTGKTYYLSRQVERLDADPRYYRGDIMIGSLTRAAATEIAGRTDLPRECVGTLHAHCYRALERPALAETAEGIKLWNEWVQRKGELPTYRMDPRANTRNVEWTSIEGPTGGTGGEGDMLLAELGVMRARMTPRELWPQRTQDFADLWERFKRDEGLTDFSDLIEQGIDTLDTAPGDPKVIMFDEAQDSSKLEFTLLRKWGNAAEQLVVVGDPWQNLYEWRGSDPAAFFAGDVESETVLARSRRVPRAVLEYSLGWIRRAPGDLPHFTYEPRFNDPNDEDSGIAEGAVEKCGHTWAQPDGLLNRVQDDLDAGRSVMVLGTCGYMLDPLISELRERGTPFANPYAPLNGRWNPMRAAGRLLSFLRPDPGTWGDESRMWAWDDVHAWADPMRANGVWQRGAKTWIQAKTRDDGAAGRFDETSETTIDLDSLLRQLASDEHREAVFRMDVDWWYGHLRDEGKRQQAYPVRVFERGGGAMLREKPRLTVGTIHSVKGAEADVVYVFPDLSRIAWETQWFVESLRAPIYRQFYVGFTRARDRLVVCSPSGATYAQLPTP